MPNPPSSGAHGRAARTAAELLERIGRLAGGHAHRSPLKPVQWEVLRYLAVANRFSDTPGAVTEYLGATKGTVSQTIIALEAKGLVARAPRPGEGRSVSLGVTDAGWAMLASDPLTALAEAIESTGHASDLREGLGDVLQAMIAAGGGRAFGICRSCRHFRPFAPDGGPHRCALLEVPLSDDDSSLICREHEAGAA